MIAVEWDARLIESAVGEGIGGPDFRAYHREREAIYELADAEDRERAFTELHGRWFRRLGFDRPILLALGEYELLSDGVDGCVITRASRSEDEGAELFGNPDESRPRLLIRLRPASFADSGALVTLLRRELLYVWDMIDPEFGYQPQLPPSPAGQTQDRLMMDRYAVLWTTSITGRLVRAGHGPDVRETARERFARAFPKLASRNIFERLFDGPRPSHEELLDLARGPHATDASCALCAMPSQAFADVTAMPVVDRIRADFPAWSPARRICSQCAGLYEAKLRETR